MNYYHLFGILSVVVFAVAIYRSCAHQTMDFIIYAVIGCIVGLIGAACINILPAAAQTLDGLSPIKVGAGMGTSYVSLIGAVVGNVFAIFCYGGVLLAKAD